MYKLFIFFTLLLVSDALVIEKPTPPKYIIVASRQRSSSTTLTRMLSSHSCVLDGNEIWTIKRAQDKLGAHDFVNMDDMEIRYNPHDFLSLAYEGICQDARENGSLPRHCETCTIAAKMFDIHGLKNMSPLFEDPEIGFVVLERPIEGQWCSWKKAEATNDWATTPGGHKVLDFKCDEVPDRFTARIQEWYRVLRSELKKASRFYTEIPFEAVASCKLSKLISVLYSEFGLSIEDISLSSDLQELFKYC